MSSEPTADPGTAIVPYVGPEPGSALATIDEWDNRSRAIRTGIDTTTDEGRFLFISALAGKDHDLQDLPGRDEVIENWLVHVREAVNRKTGEVYPALRLALLTRSGKVYSGGSKSLIDAWAALVSILPKDKHFPPVRLSITKVPRPGGEGHYLRLDRVEMADKPGARKK